MKITNRDSEATEPFKKDAIMNRKNQLLNIIFIAITLAATGASARGEGGFNRGGDRGFNNNGFHNPNNINHDYNNGYYHNYHPYDNNAVIVTPGDVNVSPACQTTQECDSDGNCVTQQNCD